MGRRLRAALLAVLVIAAVAGMVRLSLWQWHRGQSRNSWLNYSYALEWLVFAALTVVGVVRLVVEDRRRSSGPAVPAAEQPLASGARSAPAPVVGPPLRPGEEIEEITWVRLRRRLDLDLDLGGR